MSSGLDVGALQHMALLKDPCNAPLKGTVYSGLGTGQYRRYRVMLPSAGSSVEGTYVFSFASNRFFQGTHVAGTAGTAYTYNAAQILINDPSLTQAAHEARCIAGCVKVRYTGPESDRAGLIGLAVMPGCFAAPAGAGSATGDMQQCPFVHRFGEVAHEVKFVPNAADEQFKPLINLFPDNSSIVVTYRGIPAATLTFEVTVVYEVEQMSGVMPIACYTPSSNNTLNQVLRALGPPTMWAFSNVVVPTIRATVQKVARTGLSARGVGALGAALMSI